MNSRLGLWLLGVALLGTVLLFIAREGYAPEKAFSHGQRPSHQDFLPQRQTSQTQREVNSPPSIDYNLEKSIEAQKQVSPEEARAIKGARVRGVLQARASLQEKLRGSRGVVIRS